MNVCNSKPRRAEGYGRADDHRRTRRRDEGRARQKTTAELTTALPLFEAATGRIAELVSRIGDPEPRRRTMDRPGQARRVPRRAADLMEKRARPRSKRPRPRSGRGVGCTRHPCRQASLRRVSPRRRAGRPHPPAMGALSVIQWGAAPDPVACRRLGPVYQPGASPRRSRAVTGPAPALWPHARAAKAIRAVFGLWGRYSPLFFTEILSRLVYLRSISTIPPTF